MARRVELVSAGLASAVALLWLLFVNREVAALTQVTDFGMAPFFKDVDQVGPMYGGTAVLILGITLGAYLHAIFSRTIGFVVLLLSAGLLIVDLGVYEFAGWGVLPSLTPFMEIYTGAAIPTLLPVLEVVATACAAVAVLAGIAPTGARPRVRAARIAQASPITGQVGSA